MQTNAVQTNAVLFDFDNTLAPSLHYWVHAFQSVFAQLGVPMTYAEAETRCLHRGWEAVAADMGVCTAEELRDRMHAALPSHYLDVALFPHAEDVIARCHAAGRGVALVTSSPRSLIVDVLDRLGLAGSFHVVICGDDVARMKPNPEPVRRALEHLGAAPEEAIMIGDSSADVIAGRRAGTRTALHVPPGATDAVKEQLRALAPDHEFADLAELADLLGV